MSNDYHSKGTTVTVRALLLSLSLSLTAGLSTVSHAQGLGDLVRGVLGKILPPSGGESAGGAKIPEAVQEMVVNGIRSVTGVDFGQVAPGLGAPNADEQGRVVLFSTSWCGYCKRAIEHMKKTILRLLNATSVVIKKTRLITKPTAVKEGYH